MPKKKRVRNDNPSKPQANLVGYETVISQVHLVANVKEWVVNSSVMRHICANKEAFTFHSLVGDGED